MPAPPDAELSAQDAGHDEVDAPSTACDFATIVEKNCLGCHNTLSRSGQLSLQGDDLHALLSDQPGHASCANELLIDSQMPEASLLYRKLGADVPCGARMPIGGQLSAADQACVLDWIRDEQSAAN